MKTIPIKTVSRRKSSGDMFKYTIWPLFIVTFIVFGFCTFQVNTLGSQTKKMETEIAQIGRDTTALQTKIYSATKEVDFMAKVSRESNVVFSEPRDVSILYMRLPDTTTLVMK